MDGALRVRQASILHDHSEQVRFIAFSPHDEMLAAACLDGTVWCWQVATGIRVRILQDVDISRPLLGHVPLPRLAFSPDAAHLAVAIGNGHIRVYDSVGETEAFLSPSSERWVPTDVVFSVDGTYLLAADDLGLVHFWDVATWHYTGNSEVLSRSFTQLPIGRGESQTYPLTTTVGNLVGSNGQKYLVLISNLTKCLLQVRHIIEVPVGSSVWMGPTAQERSFEHPTLTSALSLSGNTVAMVDTDSRCVNVLSSQSLDHLATISIADDIPVATCFALGDRILAIAGGWSGRVWFWDIDQSSFVGWVPSHTGGWGPEGPARKIGAMASNQQGNLIAVAGMDYPEGTAPDDSYYGPVDWTIKLWELSSME